MPSLTPEEYEARRCGDVPWAEPAYSQEQPTLTRESVHEALLEHVQEHNREAVLGYSWERAAFMLGVVAIAKLQAGAPHFTDEALDACYWSGRSRANLLNAFINITAQRIWNHGSKSWGVYARHEGHPHAR